MKKELIITKDGSHSLFVPDLNETYHSVHGSISEAIHVFINSGLLSHPKKKINILEIGFGTGLNTLLTLENIKNRKIHYTSLEPYPISSEIYNKLNFHTVTNSNAETFFKLHTSDWEEKVFISENFTLYKTQKKIQNFKKCIVYLGLKTYFSISIALFFTNCLNREKSSTNIENK